MGIMDRFLKRIKAQPRGTPMWEDRSEPDREPAFLPDQEAYMGMAFSNKGIEVGTKVQIFSSDWNDGRWEYIVRTEDGKEEEVFENWLVDNAPLFQRGDWVKDDADGEIIYITDIADFDEDDHQWVYRYTIEDEGGTIVEGTVAEEQITKVNAPVTAPPVSGEDDLIVQ